MNQLYYGDNLHVIREHINDESIDLVYLDPPFKSKRDYNLLFKPPNGHESDAQIIAFEDTRHLHCDPTASHYLKIVMDGVFAKYGFRNDIAWKRTPFSGSSKSIARQYPRNRDIILFYTKGSHRTWNKPSNPYSEEYLKRFKWDDNDNRGPYRKTLLKTYSQKNWII